MNIIKQINCDIYNSNYKDIKKHIKTYGIQKYYELILDNTYGSPDIATILINAINTLNVKLRVYTIGEIKDGGIILVSGATECIAYDCTTFSVNKPVSNMHSVLYKKYFKHNNNLLMFLTEPNSNNVVSSQTAYCCGMVKEIRQRPNGNNWINCQCSACKATYLLNTINDKIEKDNILSDNPDNLIKVRQILNGKTDLTTITLYF
jgi:hypothetical protein